MNYARRRFPNRPWLQDLTPSVFNDHVDFILGKHVAGLESKGVDGITLYRPQWDLILAYEYQIRKQAYKWVATMKSDSLGAALAHAQEDLTVRNLYFLTPLQIEQKYSKNTRLVTAMGSLRDAPPLQQQREQQPRNRSRSRPKTRAGGGRKRNAGKGANNRSNSSSLPQGFTDLPRLSTTRDGKSICYAFNNASERCKDPNCPREHACWWGCSERHPGHMCPKMRERNRDMPSGDRPVRDRPGNTSSKGKAGRRGGGKGGKRH
jgi:hypothetical protein